MLLKTVELTNSELTAGEVVTWFIPLGLSRPPMLLVWGAWQCVSFECSDNVPCGTGAVQGSIAGWIQDNYFYGVFLLIFLPNTALLPKEQAFWGE